MKKVIKNSKGYVITDEGVVYGPRKKLKQELSNSGYYRVTIRYEDGSVVKQSVHRLVAENFVPNEFGKPLVNHIDGNKENNRYDNLEWVDYKENAKHASDNGLLKYVGENHYNNTNEESLIREICKLLEQGFRNKDICKELSVRKSLVSQVRNGTAWKHVSSEYEIKRIRQKRVSVNTVLWVCYRLQDGLTVNQILEIADNLEITKPLIYDIKSRNSYKEISKEFNF